MGKISKTLNSLLILAILLMAKHGASKVVNEIIATVNEDPISSLDIAFLRQEIKQLDEFSNLETNSNNKQLLEHLIDRAIINQVAEEETLRAPEDKLEERIKAMLEMKEFENRKQLDAYLKEKGSSLASLEQEIRRQLIIMQIMNLYTPVKPPNESDVRQWYELNRDKLGKEINIREIAIRFNPQDIKSEINTDQKIREIRNQILSGTSFSAMARRHSQRATAKDGGNLGWKNLAALDPMQAGVAYQMRNQRSGAVSIIFKTKRSNEYMLIQFIGFRDVPYEDIKDRIFNLLYSKKQQETFNQWLKNKKKEVAVTIYQPQ